MNAFFSSQHFLQNFALDNSNLQITRTFFIFLKGSSKETEQGKWQCKNKVFVFNMASSSLAEIGSRQTVVTQVTIFLSCICSAKLVKLSIANCLHIVVVVLHLKLFNIFSIRFCNLPQILKFVRLVTWLFCSLRAKLCQVYPNLEKTAKIKLTFWTHKMNA